jgi:hypothetical protein
MTLMSRREVQALLVRGQEPGGGVITEARLLIRSVPTPAKR